MHQLDFLVKSKKKSQKAIEILSLIFKKLLSYHLQIGILYTKMILTAN